MLLFFNFVFIKESKKKYHMFQKIIKQHKSFNTDNKSAYYYDFWRSCDTEDWSNDAENSALHHRNKLYFKVY